MKKNEERKKKEKTKINLKDFKIMWKYLKDDKLKLFTYIFLTVLSSIPDALTPFVWGVALEKLVEKDLYFFTIALAIYVGIWIVAQVIIQKPKEMLYNSLEIKFTKNITKDLYRKIDCLPAIAFEDIGVGEFINRLYTDPDRIMSLLSKLIKLILRALVAVFAVIMAFSISIVLGIEILVFALFMGITSNIYFPKIKKIQKSIKEESDKYVKYATENITGIREIKSLGIKSIVEKKLFNNIDTLYVHNRESLRNEVNYYCMNNLLYFILQFIILLSCGYLFINGKIAYSLFIMMEMYLWRIDYVVESISDFGVDLNKVAVSIGRINDILENRLYQDDKYGSIKLDKITGDIKFDNVKFKYRNEEEFTLKGLDMEIVPNKKIAIVGRSGNGKSTIFNLLLRYFDATLGNILIDGVNIKDLSEETLRGNISIIRQAPFLFNLSIMDNFKLVKDSVSLEEVKEVCKRAYIDEYIESLPNGYDTIIGEGGINLSGGQKQRIAIARTLLLNTKIILFDEATSALDNESQEYIKKTIDDLVVDHTVVIVAHRLSTIIDADIINVIENGKLVSSGTHDKLLKSSEVYQKLYKTESSNSLEIVE